MQEELEKVMDMFIQNADKLAPLGSSQANEAMNNTIGSKAPKIRHYGGSESNDYRVACAVSQKNLGRNYVSEVRTSVLAIIIFDCVVPENAHASPGIFVLV